MPGHAPISCSEVWGGNRAAEAALVLPGLSGWVFARPYHGQREGGDVHYVSSCGTGKITRVLLADVAGHGEEVASVGRDLRALMQRYLNHEQPQKLAARLNRDMSKVSERTGKFATALVITFFSPRGRLSICNAGHPTPMIYRAMTHTWSAIDQPDTQREIANLPLGIVEDSGYVGRELTLDAGDLIFGYTDCLTEARHKDGPMLGEAGLFDVLSQLDPEMMSGAPSVITQTLLDDIERRGYQLDDDLTAVVLKCTTRSNGAGLAKMIGGLVRFVLQLRNPRLLPWPDGILRLR